MDTFGARCLPQKKHIFVHFLKKNMPLLRPWAFLALFCLYLSSVFALIIFSVQMSKSGRFMISDTFSDALGDTLLTEMAMSASYTVLFAMTVLNVSIILDLQCPCLIFPVLFAELAFTVCLACDANAGAEEVACHNISCVLGGVVYFLYFVYVFTRIQECHRLGESFEGKAYVIVSFAMWCCFACLGSLLLGTAIFGSPFGSAENPAHLYSIGIGEMIVLFLSVLFVSLSAYLAATLGK